MGGGGDGSYLKLSMGSSAQIKTDRSSQPEDPDRAKDDGDFAPPATKRPRPDPKEETSDSGLSTTAVSHRSIHSKVT